MSVTGPDDGPPYRLGLAIADLGSALFATQGILAALLARERTGRGQRVDIAMLDSVAALLTYQAGIYFATGAAPMRMGNRHPSIAPYDTYRAADGDLVLAVGNDDQFRRLCMVLGRPDLASDPRFTTNAGRVEHYESLKPALDFSIGARTLQRFDDRASRGRRPRWKRSHGRGDARRSPDRRARHGCNAAASRQLDPCA